MQLSPRGEGHITGSSQGETILIIDDDACIRDACQQTLTRAGYRVETAANGKAGLEKAKEMAPDMALVDFRMPGISGMDVMDQLDLVSPGTIKMVVTGETSVDLESEIIGKGRAVGYLAKPFSPMELNLAVRQALEQKNRNRIEEENHGS